MLLPNETSFVAWRDILSSYLTPSPLCYILTTCNLHQLSERYVMQPRTQWTVKQIGHQKFEYCTILKTQHSSRYRNIVTVFYRTYS